MKNEAVTNYIGALVDELIKCGVRDVIISPGSRNTPISLLFMEREVNKFINIDERSASYFGLGISKYTNKPTVLVSTSGTGATNFYSAIASANIMRTPIIVLTADRPPRLRGVGAPQTIDQINLYGKHVKKFIDLNLPSSNIDDVMEMRKIIQDAYITSIDQKGVVHINIPIDEPLIPDLDNVDFSYGSIEKIDIPINNANIDLAEFKELINNKKIMFAAGLDDSIDYFDELLQVSTKMNAPILADPLSNIRQLNHELTIDKYDAFLRYDIDVIPDYIIHTGAFPVSKRLLQYIQKNNIKQIIIDEFEELRNPALNTVLHIKGKTKEVLAAMNKMNHVNDTEFTNKWIDINKNVATNLDNVNEVESLFEGKIVKLIQDNYKNGTIFISNSLSIRYFDYFYSNDDNNVRLLCNRGPNGIDGVTSTALGVATKTKENTILVTGDLTFYHDLTSLLVAKTHNIDLTVILFNNDGGGIFEFLPQTKEKHYEDVFETPHGIDFKPIVEGFNHNYVNILSYQHFIDEFVKSINRKGLDVLEIKIDKRESKRIHDSLIDRCMDDVY